MNGRFPVHCRQMGADYPMAVMADEEPASAAAPFAPVRFLDINASLFVIFSGAVQQENAAGKQWQSLMKVQR